MSEPRIEINGVALTEATATTLRVAASHFASVVAEPEMAALLGPIAQGYRDRLQEILLFMAQPRSS